ncbi:hypothetical protein HPB48_005341 [Haemaphysalis longicornis]|uniref:Uncharacterized protein n=1 Tax=Haemaphysalis longicornis TaxID=44386 RepID=A0A9J6GHQ5_HAELO|nr:hypothetical protein HPB48_005341 [Haemaphysalis longicornis]
MQVPLAGRVRADRAQEAAAADALLVPHAARIVPGAFPPGRRHRGAVLYGAAGPVRRFLRIRWRTARTQLASKKGSKTSP